MKMFGSRHGTRIVVSVEQQHEANLLYSRRVIETEVEDVGSLVGPNSHGRYLLASRNVSVAFARPDAVT
jgi:hypothetical protein